ncbi:MAG: shikimate dehydrogenase [Acholeplasmataceae bacterium]|nr:shikimate dehydrogenase [Acholeplasmataceae bacterium]
MSIKLGLVGKNIKYSKSPQIHQAMNNMYNLDMTYELFDIEEAELSSYIQRVRENRLKGFNVTTPYKEKVISFLDDLTPKAKRIGAVNIVYKSHGKVIGDNTDYDGFIGLLKYHNIHVTNQEVYILGSGGAAKACYVALSDLGAHVTVVTRNPKKHPLFGNMISYDNLDENKVDLFIQATPIGTYPNISDSVLSKDQIENHRVVDLIYAPEITQIVKNSKLGVNGQMMLIIQAIESESLWLNKKTALTENLIKHLKEVIQNE